VGGEHWAYQGLDQIVVYLEQHAPPDAVLYHHWLRWHYTYYLHGTTFELRWWQSGDHLHREALRTPERAQYIVLPDWRTLEPDAPGITLRPRLETKRRDGTVSLTLYQIDTHHESRITNNESRFTSLRFTPPALHRPRTDR